jgi:hypothetical protein
MCALRQVRHRVSPSIKVPPLIFKVMVIAILSNRRRPEFERAKNHAARSFTFFEGWGQDPAQVQEIAPTAMRRSEFVKLCVRGRSGLACGERPAATQAVYRPPLLAQRFVVVVRQIGRPFV